MHSDDTVCGEAIVNGRFKGKRAIVTGATQGQGHVVCQNGPDMALTWKAVCTDEAAQKSISSRTPITRSSEPGRITSIAAFLASEDRSYIAGEPSHADGGRLGLSYTVPVG